MKRADLLLLGVVIAVVGIMVSIQIDSNYYLNATSTAWFNPGPFFIFKYGMYVVGLLSGGLWAYYRFVKKR